MQTFLPYSDFRKSLSVLDYRRLGKQRVEASQIISVLEGRPTKSGKSYKGWKNHPAVLMWKGYEDALKLYYNECVKEWVRRGYNNTMRLEDVQGTPEMPHWLGREDFHASHRSNLLRKDKDFYSRVFKEEEDDKPYIWVRGKETK